MDNEIKLTLVIPSKVYLEEKVASVIVPAVKADVTVLPERAPSVFVMDFGVVQILDKNCTPKKRYFVQSGTAEVIENNCRILTQGVIPYDDINQETALQKMNEAENEQERLFYQMILDQLQGIRKSYLQTMNMFSIKVREKTVDERINDIREGIEDLRKRNI